MSNMNLLEVAARHTSAMAPHMTYKELMEGCENRNLNWANKGLPDIHPYLGHMKLDFVDLSDNDFTELPDKVYSLTAKRLDLRKNPRLKLTNTFPNVKVVLTDSGGGH